MLGNWVSASMVPGNSSPHPENNEAHRKSKVRLYPGSFFNIVHCGAPFSRLISLAGTLDP